MTKRRMSLRDAMSIVPDDLPDGAFWAMAHEIAGADYGCAWDELNDGAPEWKPPPRTKGETRKVVPCPDCGKRFRHPNFMQQHRAAAHKANP